MKMSHLRELFERLRFTNVETFIASGNVIFDSPSKNTRALEKQIETLLQQTFGYAVITFVRSVSEIAAINQLIPSKLDGGNTLYIAFTKAEPSGEAKQKLLPFKSDVDDFQIAAREVYWFSRKTISESKFSGAQLERILGMPATIRNANTVKRLAAKYADED